MKFIPILFSTLMVQAIQEGRKTQTRREVNFPQVWPDLLDDLHAKLDVKGKQVFDLAGENRFDLRDRFGKPGDVLWVREAFYELKNKELKGNYFYKAEIEPHGFNFNWKPSIHMPKAACRIFLKVVSVNVQRLQDISEADSITEGVLKISEPCGWKDYLSKDSEGTVSNSRSSFLRLWVSINGGNLNANPWVWVVEFERIDKPENFL